MNRTLGYITLVIGIILVGFGINSSQAIIEKAVEGMTGRYTEGTMWYIIGGVAMMIAGAISIFRGTKE